MQVDLYNAVLYINLVASTQVHIDTHSELRVNVQSDQLRQQSFQTHNVWSSSL